MGPFPHAPRSELTQQQRRNLRSYENKIMRPICEGDVQMDDVLAMQVDRAPCRVFKQQITINGFPTLTTQNMYLFIVSAHDMYNRTADNEREFFRKPWATERMAAQGFLPDIVLHVPRAQRLFAAGNAYPPRLIMANLHPFLKLIGESPIDLKSWPTEDILQDDREALLAATAFSGMLRGRGKAAGSKEKPARKRPASRMS